MSRIRVSQQVMFSSFVTNMNSSLSELMDLNEQASSQKKVNRPSDDPSGTANILQYRYQLSAVSQYEGNVDTAQGWLKTADQTMMLVDEVAVRARELAEQGATGTLSADNREQIAYEARQLLNQLINLANTEFNGSHIFAGQETDDPPYTLGMMLQSVPDEDSSSYLDVSRWSEGVEGADLDHTLTLKFVSDQAASGASTSIGSAALSDLSVRYSLDGGETWKEQEIGNKTSFTVSGVKISLREGAPIVLSGRESLSLNDGRTIEDTSGTLLHVMPTAVYGGDDESQVATNITGSATGYSLAPTSTFTRDVHIRNVQQVQGASGSYYLSYEFSYSADPTSADAVWSNASNMIDINKAPFIRLPDGDITINGGLIGAGTYSYSGLEFSVLAGRTDVETDMTAPVNAWAEGNYGRDVVVRIDESASGASGTYALGTDPISYSYSLDGGVNWVTGNVSNYAEFPVPGGTMHLDALGSNASVSSGDQFFIHPRRADINVDISVNTSIRINNIGYEIFGGMREGTMATAFGPENEVGNLFNSLGKLVGYLETNSQDGVQQALDNLRSSSETILVQQANIGARENRLEITSSFLTNEKINKSARLSALEDVDVTELMTSMAQENLIYESVLKSSSMIMNMSLLDFI